MSGETEKEESGWTTDTLRYHFQQQIDDMRRLLDERYATQTKAVDAAFLAQQTAMSTALTAAERAVQTALLAAEKAVNKAEVAAERRFEAVNEFRGQLSDQAATFMPRTEADVRISSLAEKVDAIDKRQDVSHGRSAGLDKGWGYLLGAVGLAGGAIAIVVAVTQ